MTVNAASIRAATESETFDLAGQAATTIQHTVQAAFSEPLASTNGAMIRVTLVTGAGKLARQKYDPDAAKVVTTTLKELGYHEDKAASAVLECAGTFKLQHDTAKNLKTVVVFPRIVGDTAQEAQDPAPQSLSLLSEDSPQRLLALSSIAVFEGMLQSKCPSWSQKRACVQTIESLKGMLQDMDQKLLGGNTLDPAEQDFYDSVSLDSLQEKEALAKNGMHLHVEQGHLTKSERDLLLHQVQERIAMLQLELQQAKDMPKKAEKAQALLDKALERQSHLQSVQPKAPVRLKHHEELVKLWTELAPLLELQEDPNKLLSVKETQLLARKHELEQQIEELEEACRGWFEEDDAFAARVQATRNVVPKPKKTVAKTTSSSAMPNWVTPSRATTTKPKTNIKPKKSTQSGGGVFAAMMMDSDSE